MGKGLVSLAAARRAQGPGRPAGGGPGPDTEGAQAEAESRERFLMNRAGTHQWEGFLLLSLFFFTLGFLTLPEVPSCGFGLEPAA